MSEHSIPPRPPAHDETISGAPAQRIDLGTHADASWLEFLPGELVRRARTRRSGTRVLTRLLLRHYGLAAEIDRATAERHPWALSDPDRIRAAAVSLGAAALSPLIRQVIERRRALEVRAGLGDAAYLDAMTEDTCPVAPLPTDAWAQCASPEDYRRLATRIGLALMMDALRSDAAQLSRRVQLLFHRDCRTSMQTRPRALDPDVLRSRLDDLCRGDR